jgi:hypothetical protein
MDKEKTKEGYMNIGAIIAWFQTNWQGILIILAALYGFLAAIVKIFPTIPDKGVWHILLVIVKFLGKLTNNQTDDEAVRAGTVTPK